MDTRYPSLPQEPLGPFDAMAQEELLLLLVDQIRTLRADLCRTQMEVATLHEDLRREHLLANPSGATH